MSAGETAIIELAGLSVRNPTTSIGPLPAPKGLSALPGSNPGTVALRWQFVRGTRSYLVQYAESATLPSAFNRLEMPTRSKYAFTGLVSGARYWFRVAALGAAGPSPWTNAVSVVTQ